MPDTKHIIVTNDLKEELAEFLSENLQNYLADILLDFPCEESPFELTTIRMLNTLGCGYIWSLTSEKRFEPYAELIETLEGKLKEAAYTFARDFQKLGLLEFPNAEEGAEDDADAD